MSAYPLRFEAIAEAGRLRWTAPAVVLASLSRLDGRRLVVEISPEKIRRSSQANRRYWSCVVPVFQSIWSQARTEAGLPGYTKDETHEVLVQVLLGCEDGPLPGSRLRVRTSDMDSEAFREFTKRAEELLAHEYRVRIPDQWEAD